MPINHIKGTALLATPIQVPIYSSLSSLVLLLIVFIIEKVSSITSSLLVSPSLPFLSSFSFSSFFPTVTLVSDPSILFISSGSSLAALFKLDYPVSLIVLVQLGKF